MQPNLEKRVSALEQASTATDIVLHIVLVGLGEAGMEIVQIKDSYGNHWARRPEESEETFKARASSESPRNENKVALLFGEIADVGHWRDSEAKQTTAIQRK